MVIPSVGVGNVSVVRLLPTELVDHVFTGCGVESSEHGVGMDNRGFRRCGDGSGGGSALECDIGDR